MRAIAGIVAVLLAVPAWAQEAARPGPEHERLKAHDGTWETTTKAGGLEHKGSITYKLDLGGMWQVGVMEGEAGGQKYYGRAMNTYDARKKKYVSVWFDSLSASPVTTEGTYDEGQKAFLMAGEVPARRGRRCRAAGCSASRTGTTCTTPCSSGTPGSRSSPSPTSGRNKR